MSAYNRPYLLYACNTHNTQVNTKSSLYTKYNPHRVKRKPHTTQMCCVQSLVGARNYEKWCSKFLHEFWFQRLVRMCVHKCTFMHMYSQCKTTGTMSHLAMFVYQTFLCMPSLYSADWTCFMAAPTVDTLLPFACSAALTHQGG